MAALGWRLRLSIITAGTSNDRLEFRMCKIQRCIECPREDRDLPVDPLGGIKRHWYTGRITLVSFRKLPL